MKKNRKLEMQIAAIIVEAAVLVGKKAIAHHKANKQKVSAAPKKDKATLEREAAAQDKIDIEFINIVTGY